MNELENIVTLKLYAFMQEMHDWEVKTRDMYIKESLEKKGALAGNELKEIYEKYLTLRDRKFGRLPIPNAGFPPEYDVNHEKIVNIHVISPKKVQVETIWAHPTINTSTDKNQYNLIFIDNDWKIDSKKQYSSYKNKWVKIVF